MRAARIALTLAVLCWAATSSLAQLNESFVQLGHSAIGYGTQATDRVAALDAQVRAGSMRLHFEPGTGYLRALLAALEVPIESQIALFSKTSLQAPLVQPANPRMIYFNDSVAVAWMAGGFIEIAAQDARQGATFYTLQQAPSPAPRLVRETRCLQCHHATATMGVPGFLVRSVPSGTDGGILPWLGNYTTDHRSPVAERWGGWYVTGTSGAAHLGNMPVADRSRRELDPAARPLATLSDRFDTRAHLSPYSDIVALLVFDHQMQMMNLLTRLGWEARIGDAGGSRSSDALSAVVTELVDYLLFVEEAPLNGVRGDSGFSERFAAQGPRDRMGRSLRDLDLDDRLLRYPCSYMIYSEAFEALPRAARDATYRRMWAVLSGEDQAPKYARLSEGDRRAILEILGDTKPDWPSSFNLPPSRP